MLVIGLKFYAVPSHPHLLTDLEGEVTDLEFFMINEMSLSHQSVSHQKVFILKYMNLGGPASIAYLLTPGYIPLCGAGDQNIKYRTSS